VGSEQNGRPDEIQRGSKHDRGESKRRIEALTSFAERVSEDDQSTRYRDRVDEEDQIAHLTLRMGLPQPRRTNASEQRKEREWQDQQSSSNGELSMLLRLGSDRPRPKFPRGKADYGELDDSEGVVHTRDVRRTDAKHHSH